MSVNRSKYLSLILRHTPEATLLARGLRTGPFGGVAMRSLHVLVVLAVPLAVTAGVETTAGSEVVAVEEPTLIGRPGKGCSPVPPGTVLRVTRAEGEWVHVTHGGRPGWVGRSSVVRAAEAEELLADAVRGRPSAAAFLARGRYRLHRGDTAGAVADCDEALRRWTGTADAYLLRAEAHETGGNHVEAEADLSKALARSFGSWERSPILTRRAAARAATGRYAEALADYDAAIDGSLLRISPRAHAGKAWLLATCPDARYRDGRAAVGHATTACAQSSNRDADHVATLAAAHAEAGEFEKAVALQRAALEAALTVAPAGDAEDYRVRLASYEAGRPYRESVRAAGRRAAPVEARRP